jgi:hypothetical protein
MDSYDSEHNENLTLSRVGNLLGLTLKNLEYERDKLKSLTDDSIGVFENIRNTLFSFLGLGFSIIFGLPFVLGEEYNIEPLWFLGVLILIVAIGSIIYVDTNFYSNRLRTSLGEIDRVYLDGVISLSLLELFFTRRTIKYEQPLSATEIRSLFTYVELVSEGIYCTLDNKFNEITTKVPIKRLKRNLQSESPIDPIFVDEICASQRKNIESNNIPSIKDILHLHTNFPDIMDRMFMSSLKKRCGV